MKGVRYVRPDGWEGYCPVCMDWYPVDLEFWPAHLRGGMCRACYREWDSLRHRSARVEHPELLIRDALRQREYRAGLTVKERQAMYDKRRDRILATRREWWKTRPPEVVAQRKEYARAYRLAHREEASRRDREWRARQRAEKALAA